MLPFFYCTFLYIRSIVNIHKTNGGNKMLVKIGILLFIPGLIGLALGSPWLFIGAIASLALGTIMVNVNSIGNDHVSERRIRK